MWLVTVPALTIVDASVAVIGYLDNVGLLMTNSMLR